ncbi:MAG: phosphoribosylformylglycinamidine synthase subunit PurS [Ignavibacteriaceae bacterium]|nr:phosphoribosylformylglycinamidine synthase subunit PurS [Ignavibacteriaceae bacterium]
MYSVQVFVKRRKSILDPQGKAVEQGARLLGYSGITDVRVNKQIDFTVNTEDEQEARSVANDFCSKLLANPVMEEFQIHLQKL